MERNIVVLCLDSVRRDYFDSYATRIQDRTDVRFCGCRAAGGSTPQSHASLFTGQCLSEHRVGRGQTIDYTTIDRSETFLRDLTGYTSIGVSANPYAGPDFGFDHFFDEFVSISPHCRFPEGIDVRRYYADSKESGLGLYARFLADGFRHENTIKSLSNGLSTFLFERLKESRLPMPLDGGAGVVSGAVRKSVRRNKGPKFVFANYMDAHGPLYAVSEFDSSIGEVPRNWRSGAFDLTDLRFRPSEETVAEHATLVDHYRTMYARAIDHLDRTVASLIDDLLAESDRETTIIVTADHGENLCFPDEEYLFQHNASLSEAILHVPCAVVNPPDGCSETVREYFSHLRFGDLVTGLAGRETPVVTDEAVVAEQVDRSGDIPGLSDSKRAYFNRAVRCAYRDNIKYVWDTLGETQRVTVDPSKPCKIIERSTGVNVPEWARSNFEDDISALLPDGINESFQEVSEGTLSRLEELGYR